MAISKITTGSISDSVAIDTDTLVVDGANNRVGVGTAAPDVHLHLQNDTNPRFRVEDTTNNVKFDVLAQNNDVKMGNNSNHDLRIITNNAERMRIDASGNVGIGTSSPSSYNSIMNDLVVYGSADSGITIASGSSSEGSVAFADSTSGADAYRGWINYSHSSDFMRFFTNAAEAMRIDSGGNVLVGKTTTSSSDPGVHIYNPGNYGRINITKTVSGNWYALRFEYSGSIVGSITYDNSSTAYNTSSDYRLKTAVNYDWDATTRLKQLKPARFEWIADGDDAVPVDGFLAHEVQTVVPEAITGTHDEVDAEGNPVYQGIDQSKLVPLLVKTIQELEARVAALEAN